MSRLVDTTICPDCRGSLDASATCTACGLPLRGPIAQQLWTAMVAADRLVEQLRAAAGSAELVAASAAPRAPLPAHSVRRTQAVPPRRRLPAASVPVVLLSLGALCLLVAAVVFVAVTWSLLGLTGRTLVLLGLTGAMAAGAVVLTRRGLRGAAETFWLVVAGMLTVDLLAAESAGLVGLDALSWRGTGALVGVSLLSLGTGVGLWARREPVARLLGAETVGVIGGLVVCSTNVWLAENAAIGSTVAVPLLGVAYALLRRSVPLTAYGLGGLGAASWLALLAAGWDRSVEDATLGAWWADGRGWPLVVAAGIGAVVVHLPGVTAWARSAVAGLALVPLVLLANAPQTSGTSTRDLLVACATVVALAAVTRSAPTVWARGAAALTGLGLAALGLWLLVGPWAVLSALEPDGRTDPALTLLAQRDNAASWSALVVALSIVAAAVSLIRHVPAPLRPAAARAVASVTPAVLALGGLVLVLELQPPLWAAVLAAALATGIAGAGAWWSRDHVPAAVLSSVATGYLALVTVYAALAVDLLAALTATVLFLTLATVAALRERAGALPSAAIAAALASLSGGWALLAWGDVMGADLAARALALAGYAGLVGALSAPIASRVPTRSSLEASAVLLGLLATVSAVDRPTTAMVLTILGTALCVTAVSTPDRSLLAWAGAAVLGVATLIRVVAEVDVPELYTLPAAALLVAAGAWRLIRDPHSDSLSVLGSGLSLALAPSLLLALDQPVSMRGALIGAAGVLTLALGVQQRLAAPFLLGAATTGVLALRHLEPVADAVPRWISLGGVGLVLLLVGVTWEARRRDLDTAHRYLAALR